MIGSTGRTKVFAYCQPVDMRKGFEGLAALVPRRLGARPARRRDVSVYESSPDASEGAELRRLGLWVLAKRLERGRFVSLWDFTDQDRLGLTKSELELFLHGSHLIGRFQLAPKPMTNKDLEVRS